MFRIKITPALALRCMKLVALGGGLYAILKLIDKMIRTSDWLRSKLLAITDESVDDFRDKVRREMTSNHVSPDFKRPHAVEASARLGMVRTMESIITRAGRTVHDVSTAERGDTSGQRLFYVSKDLARCYKNDGVTKNTVITMCDVDYYANMQQWLSLGLPIMMYTFQPMAPAGHPSSDADFTIVNDEVQFRVNGGEPWKHSVWNWNTGWYVSQTNLFEDLWWRFQNGVWGNWRSLFYDTVVAVESFEVASDPHRRLVVATPVRKMSKVLRHYYPADVTAVRRREYTYAPGINAVTYTQHGETFISLAEAGSYTAVTLTTGQWEAMMHRHSRTTFALSAGMERMLRSFDVDNPVVKSGICDKAAQAAVAKRLPEWVDLPRPLQAPHYQSLTPLVTEDGARYAESYGPCPLTAEATNPARGHNNEVAAIKGRVENVKNFTIPFARFGGYAMEFIKLCVPEAEVGKGVPMSLQDVNEIQSRPSQRTRSRVEESWLISTDKITTSSFVKSEAYANENDPRAISSMPTHHTLDLSRFTLAFKRDVLKPRCEFYMPAKTPREIVDQMIRLSVYEGKWGCTDFSRMDGRISRWMTTMVENPLYIRWCAPEFRKELDSILKREHDCPGITKTGYRYSSWYTRKSGSGLTGDPNTIDTAFVGYCSLRDLGFPSFDAWDRIARSCAYGDDGLFKGIPGSMLEKTAGYLGMVLTIDEYDDTQCVEFLSRLFEPIVPTATVIRSIPSMARALGKINQTVAAKTLPLAIRARNKVGGYLTVDPCCPLLSTYCRKVIEHYPDAKLVSKLGVHELGTLETDRPWWSRGDIVNNSWPTYSSLDQMEACELVAESLTRSGIPMTAHDVQSLDFMWNQFTLLNIPPIVMDEQPVKFDCLSDRSAIVLQIPDNNTILPNSETTTEDVQNRGPAGRKTETPNPKSGRNGSEQTNTTRDSDRTPGISSRPQYPPRPSRYPGKVGGGSGRGNPGSEAAKQRFESKRRNLNQTRQGPRQQQSPRGNLDPLAIQPVNATQGVAFTFESLKSARGKTTSRM
jgi:hypothetical protein